MFKLHASTLGRNVETRSGQAYTANGLKFAASNLVYVLLGKHGDTAAQAQLDAFVGVVQRAYAEGVDVGRPHEIIISNAVKLLVTVEMKRDYA